MGEHGHFTDTLHQNAAMASLAISVSSLLTMRKLVGAVGIEFVSLLSKSQRMWTLPTVLPPIVNSVSKRKPRKREPRNVKRGRCLTSDG